MNFTRVHTDYKWFSCSYTSLSGKLFSLVCYSKCLHDHWNRFQPKLCPALEIIEWTESSLCVLMISQIQRYRWTFERLCVVSLRRCRGCRCRNLRRPNRRKWRGSCCSLSVSHERSKWDTDLSQIWSKLCTLDFNILFDGLLIKIWMWFDPPWVIGSLIRNNWNAHGR